jgi:Lrp/AsnC family transcriptional regulator, leucine-responsive regulatory protein
MDAIDRKILRALLQDGRQTNASLADSIGLSPSATLERVRRLERNGSILGYQAVVDRTALGYGVQALIGIRLRVHAANGIEPFERGVMEADGIVSCYHVTGQFDYVLHVVARDLAHLRDLNNNQIAALPSMGRLETLVVLSEVKSGPVWPTEE